MVAEQIVDLVPDHIAVERIITKDHRLNDLFHYALIGDRHIAGAKTLAPAGDAFIRFNLDKMRRSAGIELLRISQLFGHVVPQDVALDAGNLHEFSPPSQRHPMRW